MLKFVSCFGVCIGTIVAAAAETLETFIRGRFLLPFLSILATTAAPLHLTELASLQYRRTVAEMYNTLYYIASAKGTAYVPATDLV